SYSLLLHCDLHSYPTRRSSDLDFPAEYELKPGDLVITMTDLSKGGDTLGLPALIPDGRTYLHNQRIGLVEIIDPNRVSKPFLARSEEHTSELQSRFDLVCRLLL